MPSSPTRHRWSDIPQEQVSTTVLRQYITADDVTVARITLTRGGVVPRHAHVSEQVSVVLSGVLEFVLDGGAVHVVGAGEVYQIPSNVPHEVRVLEDAVAIDIFTPIRQDWIDGTDSYFRDV